LKVAVLNDACGVGGAERYFADLSKGLLGAGIEVVVGLSSCQRNGPQAATLEGVGISSITYLESGVLPRTRGPVIYQGVRRFLRTAGPDVAHFSLHHADSCRYWIEAAAGLGIPFLLTEHAVMGEYLRASRLTWWFKRRSYRSAAMVIFVSAFGEDEVRRQWPKAAFRSAMIPPGIPDTDNASAEPLGSDVVFLGRLAEEKDPLLAIRAFQLARGVEPGAKLFVFGDGPLRGTLEAAAREPSSGGSVVVIGYTSDPDAALRKGGVFLLTSRHENSPYVVLEAMRAGRAIVATSVGDVPRMVAHGAAGVLVEPGDAASVAAGLEAVLANEALRARLGSAAAARVRADYGLESMIDSTIAAYELAMAVPQL
jgi:glycosyltransferase involved in cell wall biosynthesis